MSREKEKISKANFAITSRSTLNELSEYGVPGTDVVSGTQTLYPEVDRSDPKYERDEKGNLTQYGTEELKFDKTSRKDDIALYKKDSGRLTSFLLGRLSTPTLTTLEVLKEYTDARQRSDTFKIWSLLKASHFYGTGATKNTQLTKFINLKQGSGPLEDHLLEFQQQSLLFKGNYESNLHPGYIKIEDITRNIWLNSVDQIFYSSKIEHALDSTPDALTDDLTASFQLHNLQRGEQHRTPTSDFTATALLTKKPPYKKDLNEEKDSERAPLPGKCPQDYCEHCWIRGYAWYEVPTKCKYKPTDWKPPLPPNAKALLSYQEYLDHYDNDDSDDQKFNLL